MSLTRVSLCCVVLLAWASYAPVHSQEAVNRPGRASLRAQSPEQVNQPGPDPLYQPGPDPLNAPAPEQDYYYPEGGTPGYEPLPSASGYVPFDRFGTRFSFKSNIGDGPGWANGYQSFNGFVPITFEPDRSLLFLNGRAMVSNDGGFMGSAGAGMRFYSPEIDRVFGGSFWYDYDDSMATNYDQWGVSLESLGRYFDVRLNAYIPSNDNERTISSGLNGNITFVGQNIGIGQTRLVENALRGGDLEIGGALPFPFLGDYGVRSYLGGYYFEAAGVETTVGVKYRSEIMVTEDVHLSIGASSDKLFGENLFGSVTVYMPDGRPQRILSRQPTRERLYSNVERNYRVNVYRRELNETLRAINPDTGLPYIVHHVDNNSAPNTGDGSIRRPFGTLSDGPGAAPPGADIVFVHHNRLDLNGDPVLDGYDTGITLFDNQRLLGQGTEHLFTDLRFGVLTLPGNDGGPLPIITNLAGDVVTLANNNEVSGLQIGAPAPNAPTGNGIFGVGITDFNINRNVIQNAGLGGISLTDAAGTGSITGNIITGNTLENILISNTGVGPLTLDLEGNDLRGSLAGAVLRADASDITATITGNDFSNNTNNGLEMLAANGSTLDATIVSNVANANGGSGILGTADAGTLNLTLSNNSANSNTVNGLELATVNAGTVNLEASDNSFSQNDGSGFNVLADSGTVNLNDFSFTTLNGNTLFGMALNADNGGAINGIIDSNSLQDNLAGGLSSTLDNGSQSTLTVSNSVINGNTGFGMSFSALNGSSINHILTNNQINDNVGSGVLLSGTNGSQVTVFMDTSDISNNQGFGFNSSISDSQSDLTLVGNLFDTNDNTGIQLSYSDNSLSTQLIDGNTINNNGLIAYDPLTLLETSRTGGGITVEMHGIGGIPDLSSSIQNNTIQDNLFDGILMTLTDGTGELLTNDVNNNNLLDNGRDGLSMQLGGSSQAVLNASNNTITIHQRTTVNQRFVPLPTPPANPTLPTLTFIGTDGSLQNGLIGVNGVNLDLGADSLLTANLSNNTIDGSSNGTIFNTGSGVLMNIRQDGTLNATLTQNLIRENGVDGVHVGPDPLLNGQVQGGFNSAQGTAHIGVTLQDNVIEFNRDDGVQLSVAQVTEGPSGFTGSGVYTLSDNTIRNNGVVTTDLLGNVTRTGNGVNVEVRSGQLDLLMTNNSITNNAADGVLLRNSMGAGVDPGVQVPSILLLTNTPKSILNATLDGNTISNNGNRGVNVRFEDLTINAPIQGLGGVGTVTLTNNIIDSNNDEGVLVVTNDQRDDGVFNAFPFIFVDETDPFNDPTAVANRYPAFATAPDYYVDFANANTYADLKFNAIGNTITNNGGGNAVDALGIVAGDGMLILVGTASYVHADIRDNQFSGNFLDDFRTDSFVAGPETPLSEFDEPADGTTQVFLDHISLLDLRFTGNVGNSIGGVTSTSDGDRIIAGVLHTGRFRDFDPDQTAPQQEVKFANRRTDYFRVEDTPTAVGSVLNGTNFFTDADSQFPRNNFLGTGYVQVPIGSLFP